MMDGTAIDQRSDDWFAIRLGKATASRVADIVARTKSGYSASRANYAAQLVCERMTGSRQESYTNAAMQHGIDTEAEARAAYAFTNALEVEEVGFIDHPALHFSGASPDGLVGSDGMVEIKCPISATHIDTLLNDTIADKYVVQMQWQLACTGRAWCDFVSYDPRLPEAMRLYVRRFPRDDDRIKELEREVAAFLAEVDRTVDALKARYLPAANDSEAANILRAG
jgi:putative phage-type endonuclease